MTKPIDSIRIEILPNVMRADPYLSQDIVTEIKQYARANEHFVYETQTGNQLTLEITAAERLPVAVIDDKTLLDTLAKAAMERGVPMQDFIKQLAKEYKA